MAFASTSISSALTVESAPQAVVTEWEEVAEGAGVGVGVGVEWGGGEGVEGEEGAVVRVGVEG